MKKLIVTIFGCMFAIATWGQAKFTVPAPTDLQKYQTAVWQWHGAYVIMIVYAKSMGQSVEEAGAAAGEIAKLTWNKEMDFDAIVRSTLRTLVIMTISGKVEILEQSENSIRLLASDFYKPMGDALLLFDVTAEELSLFYESYIATIMKSFGVYYSVEDRDEGMIVTISKN
jgi:hypothetical protein